MNCWSCILAENKGKHMNARRCFGFWFTIGLLGLPCGCDTSARSRVDGGQASAQRTERELRPVRTGRVVETFDAGGAVAQRETETRVDEGERTTSVVSSATAPSVDTSAAELAQGVATTQPSADAGMATAAGGGVTSETEAKGGSLPGSPLVWIGGLLVAGGIACAIAVPLCRTAGVGIAIGGAAVLAAGLYPALVLVAVGGAAVVVAAMGWTMWKRSGEHAALTTVVGAVGSVSSEVAETVKARVAAHAGAGTRAVISAIKREGVR